MTFVHPDYLWLLPLAAGQMLLAWRAPHARRWSTGLLRVACVATAILALGQPSLSWRSSNVSPAVATLVDVGPSMPREAIGAAGQTTSSLLAFATRTEHLEDPSVLGNSDRLSELRARLDRPVWPDDPATGGSALADALSRAGAELTPIGGGTIDLFSNGAALRGDAEAEAARLAQVGVGIHVHPAAVARPSQFDAIIRSVAVPPSVRIRQAVPIVVLVESATARRARVWVHAADRSASAEAIEDLAIGMNRVELVASATHVGLTAFQAGVTAADDRGNDVGPTRAATLVCGPPRVAVVGPSADIDALRSLLGEAADIVQVEPTDLARTALDGSAALVLADVPATAISDAGWTAIERATNDGMGLLVAGTAGLASGDGYERTPLAWLLPIRTPRLADRVSPRTALVLIVDTSASMEGEKLDLAKAVARLALSHMDPRDEAGLIEFFGGQRWAAPLQPVADGSPLDRALARLSAGGGTTLYPAVEEAAFALRNVDAAVKHVLVLSDGFVEDAPFAELARSMAEDGVNLSTVGVKTDPQERNLMPDLAVWGRGRYYTVPDRFAVPDVTLNRPTVTPRPTVDRTVSQVLVGSDPIVREPIGWGSVDAVARTTPKATADALLRTSRGDPVLSRWRVGAGWSATLAVPLTSSNAAGLQRTAAFANALASLFRELTSTRNSGLRLSPIVRPGGLEIDGVATTTGSVMRPLRLRILDDRDRPVRTIDAEPISPGHWNVLAAGLPSGTYSVIADAGGPVHGSCGFAIAPLRSVPILSPDEAMLDRVERFRDVATRVRSDQSVVRTLELTRPLALAAMAFMVAHVAWRRHPRERS